MARLLVLWLLSEHPMHGYQIKKALSDDGMAFWFALEDASIYSVLRTLAKNGYAEELPTEQHGNRPPRTRYRITRSGRRFYRHLLADALANPTMPTAPIDVALAARGDLDSNAVSEALATRSKSLHVLEAQIESARSAAPAAAIVDRNLALVRAELSWLGQLDHATIT
jgi:DNA-binding PadR family transcriptional regulator